MRRLFILLVALCGLFSTMSVVAADREHTLKIYNWADYIDEDVLSQFQQWYKEQTGEDIEIVHKVLSTMKAGDDTSQAVYPRASKVLRIPPFGKLDASGSCWISNFPENRSMTFPSSPNSMKPSCFSAVPSVSGWNQWV